MRPAALILFFACAAFGQVGAPQLGMVSDGAHVRPVYGIPAAGSVAAALDYGRDFSTIAISPSQNYALAVDASTGAVWSLSAGATPLAGAWSNPSHIELSPRGSSAALWYASGGRLQIVSGLPGAPSIREIDTSYLGELPSALAVSDDGGLALGAFSDGLYAFGSTGQIGRIPLRERAQALAFYANGHDAAAATPQHIFKISNADSQAAVLTLYQTGQLNPAGLAVTWDNRHLVLAQRSGAVLNLDLQAGTNTQIDCGCSPEGVFGMGGPVFRITAFDGFTFRLFDASSESVFLVPAAAAQPEGGQ